MAPKDCSSIYVEVGIDSNDIDNLNQQIVINKVLDQINMLGFFKTEKIVSLHTSIMKNSYVRFDDNWEKVTKKSREFLKSKNIISTGRYGRWDYTSMEDSILDGRYKRF